MNLKVRKDRNRAFQAGLRERKRLRRERREEHLLGAAIEAATSVLEDAAECYTAAKRRRRGRAETERLYVARMAERGHDEETARLALAAGEAARAAH